MYLHQLKEAEQRIDGSTKEKNKDHQVCENNDRTRSSNTLGKSEFSMTTEGLPTNTVRKVVCLECCTFARSLAICTLYITGIKNMIVLSRVKVLPDGRVLVAITFSDTHVLLIIIQVVRIRSVVAIGHVDLTIGKSQLGS